MLFSIPSPAASDDDALQALPKVRFWNRIARKYAADPIADEAGYERTLARTRDFLAPHHEVLEMGCGTGTTALRLAPAVRWLHATDVSAQMIAIARERQAASGQRGVEFRLADADGALGAAERFDAVLAFNLLHLVSDLSATLREVASVLRPGGLLISKTPCIDEMSPLIGWLVPLAQVLGKAPPVLRLDALQIQAALQRQGFDVLITERHASAGRRDARPFIVARKVV